MGSVYLELSGVEEESVDREDVCGHLYTSPTVSINKKLAEA
jgi:hypothetical protein